MKLVAPTKISIETVTGLIDIKDLEALLQKRLSSASLSIIPLQISCLLREATLMILIHSSESTLFDPQAVFLRLRQILEEEQVSTHNQIQMYLIVHEQGQLETNKTAILAQEVSGREGDLSLLKKHHISVNRLNQLIPSLFKNNFSFFSLSLSKTSLLIAGAGMSLVLGLFSLYAITRPCVIDRCDRIPQSQQFRQAVSTILTTSSSEQDLLIAQENLTQAINFLQPIPSWSSYYTQAQNLLQNYQLQLLELKSVITAIQTSKKALLLSHPQTVSRRQEIQQDLQNAIAVLEKLPPERELYPFAQIKLQEYRHNLEKIKQNLKLEQQATINLDTAQQAAKTGKMRSDSAQSFSDWEFIYATWQIVIQKLKAIPPGTTAYQEAQHLLDIYTPQLMLARSRKMQEDFALKSYNQAIQQANLAKKFASTNQWSAAVINWRKALILLQQVPKTTFQSTQTQPLITTYTQAFNQAEIKLREAIKFQEVEQELNRVCHKICKNIISDNVIKVNLTSAYMQQVWQIALQAKIQGNFQTQVELVNHISRLEQGLQKISNLSQKQVIVYNSTEEVLATYESRN